MSQPKNPKQLRYRKEAIAALHVDEEINQLIRVVSPRAWIALIIFYTLMLITLIWGIFGSIPTRVEGKGILLAEDGLVYNAVAPPGGGRVAKILVEPGTFVKKDETIANLDRPDLIEKIALSKNYVERLKKEQQSLIETSKKELANRHEDLQQQRDTLNLTIETQTKNLNEIAALLKVKEDNFKKGLLTLIDMENTRRDFYASKQNIKQSQIELKQQDIQEDDFKEQWRNRLQDKEDNILSEQLKLHNMESEMQVSEDVTSPADGVILSINTAVGKILTDGASIATLASRGEGLDAIVFMEPDQGQRVSTGMPALVTPDIIEKEEFGSLKGEVLTVSPFPVANETLVAALQNPELTKEFTDKGPPTAIRIRIKRDPATFSGYQWSSSRGPEKKIIPGMVADVRITVREQPPLSLVIPTLKKLFKVE